VHGTSVVLFTADDDDERGQRSLTANSAVPHDLGARAQYILPMLTVPALVGLLAATGRPTPTVQAPGPDGAACMEARSTIRIQASDKVVARNVVAISYRITNRSDVPVTWVRFGVGGGAMLALRPEDTPVVVGSPTGWIARVDRSGPSNLVSLVWESSPEAALRPNGSLEVVVHAKDRRQTRLGQTNAAGRPLMPIDFGALPFSAGAASACWWGRTRSTWELSERDPVVARLTGAMVRPFRHDGAWHVLADVPMREGTLRLSRRPIVPKLFSSAAVSWGVVGGFSVDTSIGVGMNWTPSKYVSATMQRRFGTFFFTNRTHLRSASIDINVPYPRPPFSDVKHYDTRYLAVGVEYFQRDVVRWKGFLDGPQWYTSGHGVAVRVGVREIQWCTLC
jgi:hypothetical protein